MKYLLFAVALFIIQLVITAGIFKVSYGAEPVLTGDSIYEMLDTDGVPVSGKCKSRETCTILQLNFGLGMRSLYEWEDKGWMGSCINAIPFHATKLEDLPYVCRRECKSRRNCELWEEFSYDGIDVILTGIEDEFMVRCWDLRLVDCGREDLPTVCK